MSSMSTTQHSELGSGLQFVTVTGIDKPGPELRKAIRSHVMRRKNLGRLLPPRKKTKQDRELQHEIDSVQPIPRNFGFAASAVTFADSVSLEAVDVILKFSYISKKVLFPLEPCILFEGRAESWIAPLAYDSAFLHCMIFSAQFYFDAISLRQLSGAIPYLTPRTYSSYARTLDLLRKRLVGQDLYAQVSYTTASIVNMLACHAFVNNDCNLAKNYVKFLHRLVTLRGGSSSFGDNPKLLAEILKTDISIALHSGLSPTFFHSQESILPYPDLASLLEENTIKADTIPCFVMDNKLSQVWERMSDFCSVINLAVDSVQLISTKTFLQSMTFIVYPLLGMQFELDSIDESVRLALLAFSSSVFLPWRQLGLPYPHLRSELKTCLAQLDSRKFPPALSIWLLMVSMVSVLDSSDEHWVQDALLINIRKCGIYSWSTMRNILESLLWIGLVHDRPGKFIFDSTVSCDTVDPM